LVAVDVLFAVHLARFAGKRVTISAHVNGDGIEDVTLTDKSCEDVGIAVLTPDRFVGEAPFTRALQTGPPGTLDKTIVGYSLGSSAGHRTKCQRGAWC
jgi:hypothetical protein